VILLLLPLSLKLAQVSLVKVTSNYSTPFRLISLFAFLGISTLPTAFAVRFLISDSPDPYYFLKAGPSFTVLAGGLIVTASALQTATKNIRTELRKTNDELRWIIARKNLVIWNIRGALSRNLHGPVQSAIQVSVFDLRKALEAEIPNVDLLEKIQNKISTAIYNLDASDRKTFSIQEIFEEVIQTWKDHCNITIDLPISAVQIVSGDLATKNALVEIVREFINNAIRHAEAKNIQVRISHSGNIVSISVTNDGLEFKEESTKGLGLGLLDSIALHTSIKRISDKTVVLAEIPIFV
jgi:two-component sensor histidine kinase